MKVRYLRPSPLAALFFFFCGSVLWLFPPETTTITPTTPGSPPEPIVSSVGFGGVLVTRELNHHPRVGSGPRACLFLPSAKVRSLSVSWQSLCFSLP
jgi:hypothetical protein